MELCWCGFRARHQGDHKPDVEEDEQRELAESFLPAAVEVWPEWELSDQPE